MLKRHRSLPQGLAIASQSPEFWRRMAPDLTISDSHPRLAGDRPLRDIETERMRLRNDGFLHLADGPRSGDLQRIANAMSRIVRAGLPAAFIGVYDEVWSLVAQNSALIAGIFEGNGAMVPNFWASHSATNAGLAAMRRRPGNGIFTNGSPSNITVWIPVTDATPENGCIYVVPAGQDRNYGKSGAPRADASLSGIRALPAKAGDMLIWSGETYHWQGRPERTRGGAALLSLTWEFQSRDIPPLEGALVDSFPFVPFETRLGLLAHQMPNHRHDLSPNPVWRAVQQTLSNRFPMVATAGRA